MVFSFVRSYAQEPQTQFPLQKPRIPQTNIKHIAIDLQFDWKRKQACGTATIRLTPLNATNKICLDAAMLTINSIALQNGPNLQFNYSKGDENDALQILLNRMYHKGENITLIINYCTNWVNEIDPNTLGGTNGKGIRFTEPTSNDPIKKREIWSYSNVESNRYWFPGYDAPNDLRTTEFKATVENGLTVIANGILIDKKANADNTTTFHYKTTLPYANHQTAFVVGEFCSLSEKQNGIALTNYGYAEQKDWIRATTERLPDMVLFMQNQCGINYPYTNYSQVFVQDIGTFSGNNTFSTITENMVDDFETHADYFYLWDLTEAEALAQQWFGNVLSPKNYSDFWLTKSLAHYLNGMYNEYKNGKEEFLLYQLGFDQNTCLTDWNSGYKRAIHTSYYERPTDLVNDNYTTLRGALVLHMLRKEIGDEKWKKSIRYFNKKHKNQLVSSEDFYAVVNHITGQDMNWFFEQWLQKSGHPIFEISKQFNVTTKELQLIVTQKQKPEQAAPFKENEYYKGKVTLEIDNQIYTIQLEAKEVNVFTFPLPASPKWVNFDYESTWIKEIIAKKSPEELLYQFELSSDIMAKQTALNELMRAYQEDNLSAETKSKIKTSIETSVLGNSYWRLRFNAISLFNSLANNDTLSATTQAILVQCIEQNTSWVKANAIRVLGTTGDIKYTNLYLNNLQDKSKRVVASAAASLAKTKSPLAYENLLLLMEQPSMKSQNRIAALNGLALLGDSRGFDCAMNALSDTKLPRWRLATSNWDYRVFAAKVIASLGKSDQAFILIQQRINKAIDENDIDGLFNNLILINALSDTRGTDIYQTLKERYKNNPTIINALLTYEMQFNNK